jgi:hypothetical protein
MVRDLHVEHQSLNFLLKNYISKKKFQHIVGTGRSKGAFCYSVCSSGTNVTWEKVAQKGVGCFLLKRPMTSKGLGQDSNWTWSIIIFEKIY